MPILICPESELLTSLTARFLSDFDTHAVRIRLVSCTFAAIELRRYAHSQANLTRINRAPRLIGDAEARNAAFLNLIKDRFSAKS